MKVEWAIKPLGEICKVFADGDWVESKDQSEEGIRLIQTGNIGEGVFKDRAEKARYISEETFKRLRCTEIFEGDCLVSRLPDPVGRSCILPDAGERMITAVDCTIVRFDQEQCLPTFFSYYSQSSKYLEVIAKECTGTTRSRISRSNLALTPIPLPPLPEQHRIVAILDEAFDGIATAKANAEQNLQNARALFESHLQQVFTERGEGWVERPLEAVVSPSCSLSYGIVQPGNDFPNGLPIVRPTDLTTKLITIDGLKRIDPNLAESYKRTTLQGGDLLLCVRGSTGVVSVAAAELAGANVTRGIVPIIFEPSILRQDFGFFLMTSELVQSQIQAKTYGTALMQINIGDLRKIVVAMPPLEIQEVMATELDKLRSETQRLESLYRHKLAALEELKKSLLHQAFSGQM